MSGQETFGHRDQGAFLTQRDLEERWKLSGRTLERWRAEHFGPAWFYMGGSVRYRFSDVLAFEERHRKGPRG
ncbi:helix-turn-helix domain-containing protein [Roseibacterium sp. SDUM158016]|uniref:helix-turn-helix transcriptional regulator n=1 Tax=Roseicyclus sediminis TaxID=2980997 RepID=UPI0021D1899F|nr:helix-turn-helix domain-containing protein [Roseibacterium sp. SDUM158016]MCU4654493.1 helix-turn-helix domain-containing protein [Roseibacterium sp. SDUM158016]